MRSRLRLLTGDLDGARADATFNLAYSPVRDDRGGVGGVLVTVTDATGNAVAGRERRIDDRSEAGVDDLLVCHSGFLMKGATQRVAVVVVAA